MTRVAITLLVWTLFEVDSYSLLHNQEITKVGVLPIKEQEFIVRELAQHLNVKRQTSPCRD